MTEKRANAYRHLLYMAFVDIRNFSDHRGAESANPIGWRRGYRAGRIAGAIADWLHNMAAASAEEFESFDEEAFWNEFRFLNEQYPDENLMRYRKAFEESEAEKRAGGSSYWP